jgi:hypothetical protein
VVLLSLSARPCRLVIYRAFFVGVDDFVDDLKSVKTPISSEQVLREADIREGSNYIELD